MGDGKARKLRIVRHRRKPSKAVSSSASSKSSLRVGTQACAIVVTEVDNVEISAENENDKNAKRISMVSTSSAESAHSDSFTDSTSTVAEGEKPSLESTSTFYVTWD